MNDLIPLLRAMIENKATDMHLTSGVPPCFRVRGKIVKAKMTSLRPVDIKKLCYSVMTQDQRQIFEREKQIDFSFGIRDLARFRANFFLQRGAVAGAIRYIPFEIPKLASLGLPNAIHKIYNRPRGLFLVTGPTGSGKSTTLASIIETLNENERLHVVTIEDPIEYIHSHKNSIINQRELGQDADSFALALRACLREDPDVILVGEMRDLETIETALVLAETGHLVLSTLHTNSAYESITRMIQVFPTDAQEKIKVQLSMVLEGVLTQALIERSDTVGKVLACELLIPNPSVRNLIRENKIYQLPSVMMSGQDQSGMVLMNQSLAQLVRKGQISVDTAIDYSQDPDELMKMLADHFRKAS